METLGGGSARTEVGMGRPHTGETSLWAGPSGANKSPYKRRRGEESSEKGACAGNISQQGFSAWELTVQTRELPVLGAALQDIQPRP